MLLRLVFALLLSASFLTAQPFTTPRTPADAEKLEEQLDARPDDLITRGILLRFYSQDSSIGAERAKPLRRKHILWLIEHKPDAGLLGQPAATLEKERLPAGRSRGICRSGWPLAQALLGQ